MTRVISMAGNRTGNAEHSHAGTSRVVTCIPMFDQIEGPDGQIDPGSLFVAATWLWTRFDTAANDQLCAILADYGIPLHDPTDLDQVDAGLRRASTRLFDVLYNWCRRSSYVIESVALTTNCVPPR